MHILGPTSRKRLNQAAAFVYLLGGLFLFFSLVSYYPFDPSWNTAAGTGQAYNLTGRVGALLADLLLQTFGLAAYLFPVLVLLVGWRWLHSAPIHAPWIKLAGAALLLFCGSTTLGLFPDWRPIAGVVSAGGVIGLVLAGMLTSAMNLTGTVLATLACWIVSIYMVSTFEIAHLPDWLAAPLRWAHALRGRLSGWRKRRAETTRQKAAERSARGDARQKAEDTLDDPPLAEPEPETPPIVDPLGDTQRRPAAPPPAIEDIPIRALEPPSEAGTAGSQPEPAPSRRQAAAPARQRTPFQLPPTDLLQEPAERNAWDSQELKEIAAQIKSKFEEFNVLGSVTQINPGPVVTTFEFKPEAGVKYSRITALTEDLCLGLQAESILIERIPGKPTVGIEVPNSKREVISLRQILESDEFRNHPSPLTVALGKDINGRIKVAALDSMPHLLIAGSTGSGKSVMLNSLIMSILYKATPHQVRMIMVDPKRLEFGLYEGIPHLLTPVITDAKKATNALRNAVLEMERRLKLLAALGVRNIEQYNRKVRQLQAEPRSLFAEEDAAEEELEEIPYVLIVIDELADLMMLERANVEESVTRLAQMARAVGMHLVLATQRPSVDVITGLIKANFPSRISFRVATRVDSRTVLDVMGAEHLLGKGDMLFLPPGSSRLVRVHGSYVSEAETNSVVEFWKRQAEPDYDQSFLIAPPSEEEETEQFDGPEDPLYQEAVRVVCEMGKASTSTLQRRLRLGYGRAARLLDRMQREGIIGPPDGSRPRDLLKVPDWYQETHNQLR